MTPSPEQKLAARGALSAETCCGCGAAKRRGQVFCRGCYWRLPAEVQRGLYQSAYSDAYADAYAAALEALAGQGRPNGDEAGRLF